MEPLIPTDPALETSSPKRSRGWRVCAAIAASSLVFMALCAQSQIKVTELVASKSSSSNGPLGIHGVLGRLGVFLRSIYDVVRPFAMGFQIIGTIMFVLIFIITVMGRRGQFTAMMQGFELPCPALLAFGAYFCLIGGSACMLSFTPVIREWGAELLIMFLIPATYFGHFKPWQKASSEDEKLPHFIAVLKNTALMGACIMVIGYEIPLIGKDNGPLGLGGVLGPVGVAMGNLYGVFKPYTLLFKLLGSVLFVQIYVLSALSKIGKFTGMIEGFGLPCPALMAIGGYCCMIGGAVLTLTMIPVLREWGAECLFIFLLFATYFGHYKPMKSGPEDQKMNHFLNVLKNISLMGACFMVMGYEIPLIGTS